MERSQILKSAGIPHVCDPADIDERELKDRMAKQGADVETTTASLAQAKAEEVQKRHAQALVIGADQILEYEGRWFEKPQDQDDAAETLRTLRGCTHRLISAVAVYQGEECIWRHLETASRRCANSAMHFWNVTSTTPAPEFWKASVPTDWNRRGHSFLPASKAIISPFWVCPCCRCLGFYGTRVHSGNRAIGATAGCPIFKITTTAFPERGFKKP